MIEKATPFSLRRDVLPNLTGRAIKALSLALLLGLLTIAVSAQGLIQPSILSNGFNAVLFSVFGSGPDKDPAGSAEFTETPQYTQGFEVNDVWGDPATDPNRVPSGTNGITSRTGGFHAEAVAGDFTRWGGYNYTFPSQGFTTSIDIYLNTAGGYANDTRFDFSSAASDNTSAHKRDYIFSVGFYNDGGPVGTGNRYAVSASHNSPGNPRNPARNPIAIPSSGWYTFKHTFYNNGAGVLAVKMTVSDSSNNVLGTWTLSNPADIIGMNTGGNRYGWFVTNAFPFLAIDNSVRSNIVQDAPVKVRPTGLNGWTAEVSGATAAGAFTIPPAGRPLGTGSYRSTIGADGNHFTRTHNPNFSGLRLDQMSALSYSTYVAAHVDSQAHYLSLRLDTDGDNVVDDTIYFEPVYQTATYFPSNPQPALALNTWQTWNARTGGWWSANSVAGADPGTGVKSIEQYLVARPNARIMNGSDGGVRLIAGGGAPDWNNFDGSFDNVTIGSSGNSTTFDFDPALTTVVDDDGMGTAADCNAPDPASSTIADAYSVANPGDTIRVCPGTYTTSSTVNLNKANTTILGVGPTKPVIQVASAIGNGFLVSGANVTIDNLEIQKTDLANQTVIAVQANNFTAQNNLIYGPDPGAIWDVAGFTSRAFVVSAVTGTNINNNVIHTLRQPAYLSGALNVAAGSITNNQVSGTKGWVVEGGNYTFSGNTFGQPQNQSCDIALLNTPAWLNPAFYQPLLSLSSNNDNAFICAQFAGGENGRAVAYVNAGAAPNGNGSDNNSYQTINAGVGGALTGGTVQVAPGTYNQDVVVNKSVTVSGAGYASTTIVGPKTGPNANTVLIDASNVTFQGFTVTRDGNNATDWVANVKNQGLNVQQTRTGIVIQNNKFTGNRNGIYLNNSQGNIVRRNIIDFNRTGMQLVNNVTGTVIEENYITNNWTEGLLFGLTPPDDATNGVTVRSNNISGNWYSELQSRSVNTTTPYNESGNWIGTTNPTITNVNSVAPSYDSQIPNTYPGGSATPPGGQQIVGGSQAQKLDYSPWVGSATDASPGTMGFQADYSNIFVNATSPQAAAGNPSNIQEGIDMVSTGGTVNVLAGTYAGNVNFNKSANVKGAFTVGGTLTAGGGAQISPGNSPGIINSGTLTLNSGATVNIELNGPTVGTQYDQLNVTGGVTLGNAALNVTTGYVPSAGTVFTIVNNDGADSVVGTFAGLAEGTNFYIGGNAFTISYFGGDGNDVTLTAINLCNTVSISTGITTPTGQVVNVPVTVDNTTGNELYSADFTITYNQAVIASPVVTLGTVPPIGSTLTVNSATPGTIIVSIFSTTPFTGSGNLVNIAFNAIGAPATTSPVNITAFKFNEGTPCLTVNNGLVTIVSGTITGNITYGNALIGPAPPRAVPNVTLNAVGSINTSTSTDGNGDYTLSGMGAGAYTVTPSKTGGVNTAVSGLDAALIAQYVVNLGSLNATQQTVADVSGTGGITSFDAALIARYAALLPNAGSSGTWIFTPASRSYPNVNTNQTAQDYTALLMGDVTGNWGDPGSFRMAQNPTEKGIGVQAATVNGSPGSEIKVPVTISDVSGRNVLAYQFEIVYDPAVIQPAQNPVETAESMSGDMSVTVNANTPGILRVVVFGAMPLNGEGRLLNLKFIAVGEVGTSSLLSWQQFMLNEGGSLFVRTSHGKVDITEAASVDATISGRLLTADGRGVSQARVTMTATDGTSRTVISNGQGRYQVSGLRIGETYVLSADSRTHTFTPVTVSVSGGLTNVDLIAEQ